jgi:hypothetical protein
MLYVRVRKFVGVSATPYLREKLAANQGDGCLPAAAGFAASSRRSAQRRFMAFAMRLRPSHGRTSAIELIWLTVRPTNKPSV